MSLILAVSNSIASILGEKAIATPILFILSIMRAEIYEHLVSVHKVKISHSRLCASRLGVKIMSLAIAAKPRGKSDSSVK
jgi:hypothetical protein